MRGLFGSRDREERRIGSRGIPMRGTLSDSVCWAWYIDWSANWATTQSSLKRRFHSFSRDAKVLQLNIRACGAPSVKDCGARRCSHAEVWVNNKVAGIGQCQNQPLYQFDGELTWMDGLFDMVVLNIGDHPYISWIFPKRVTRELTRLWPLEVFLSRILLRDANRV